MAYKVKQNYKDLIDQPINHKSFTRRDFLARGLATGVMSVAAHNALFGGIMRQAEAAALASCPAPVRNPGSIAQIYAEGGPTMGARFFSENQAAMMNTNMAANYGITGTNLLRLGPNMVIDTTSPFGFTLLQGPPGYVGGRRLGKPTCFPKFRAELTSVRSMRTTARGRTAASSAG